MLSNSSLRDSNVPSKCIEDKSENRCMQSILDIKREHLYTVNK